MKSEVIGRCGWGDEKNEWPRRTNKSRTLKKIKNKNSKHCLVCFFRPAISPGMKDLILKMLDKNPETRVTLPVIKVSFI